jgi:hypothetical protein
MKIINLDLFLFLFSNKYFLLKQDLNFIGYTFKRD